MDVDHIFCGGLYVKKCLFERGESGLQHRHAFDHLSVVASGFFRVSRDGPNGLETDDLGPGDTLEITAETAHTVHALTPGVWLCVHRTDCTDPAEIDERLTTTKT